MYAPGLKGKDTHDECTKNFSKEKKSVKKTKRANM